MNVFKLAGRSTVLCGVLGLTALQGTTLYIDAGLGLGDGPTGATALRLRTGYKNLQEYSHLLNLLQAPDWRQVALREMRGIPY